MAQRQAGRRSKGVREPLTVRIPPHQMAPYREMAARAGLSVGDYLVAKLAEVHGFEPPEYITRDRSQLQIPMGA